MNLPRGDQAFIDVRKLTDYSLCPSHDDGQHKARLFASALGLTCDDAEEWMTALRRAAATGEAVVGKQDAYGQRYVIDFEYTRG